MSVYIALLRGINVGGKNKIKMSELKDALEAIELRRVRTYIQSGNVLFESAEGPKCLCRRIEDQIQAVFGIASTVVLRTAEELQMVVRNCPYGGGALKEGESIHVSLLTEVPTQERVMRLLDGESGADEWCLNGREIYALFRQSVLDSRLARNIQKLGNCVTTRNLNTIHKLVALASDMQ